MKKSFALVGLAAAGVSGFLKDPMTKETLASCGNCYYNITEEDRRVGNVRCNTGGDMSKFPYSYEQTIDKKEFGVDVTDDLAENGYSTAEVRSVPEIKGLFNDNTEFDMLFCSDYLSLLKDGTVVTEDADGVAIKFPTAGAGASCVRANSKDAVKAADRDAKALYEKFGTSNGYPSGYAIDKNLSFSELSNKYGTDFTLNLPQNWCGVHMKNFFCGVVFPQVVATAEEIKVERDANVEAFGTRKWSGRGALRSINYEDCESLFQTCSRREPIEDVETEGSFKDSALFDKDGKPYDRVAMIERNNNEDPMTDDDLKDELEHSVDVSHFCKIWANGYGVASAGTALLDNTDVKVTIQFDAAASSSASILLAAVLAALALIC